MNKSRCPACGRHITLVQAALLGSRKPFDCRGCGVSLRKRTQMLLILPLLIAASSVGAARGFTDRVTFLAYVGAALSASLAAYLFSDVERA